MQVGKEALKLFLLTCDMIVYIENVEESTKLAASVSQFSKVTELKGNLKNQMYLHILVTNNWTRKYYLK